MNKPNFAKFFKDAKTAISAHSPEILVGIGIAGMITTTVLAVGATPKALRLIEEEKEKQTIERQEVVEKLKPMEVVKVTWKCYIPATATGIASIACLIGASRVNLRRNAALATAYKLSETALSEYKDKVVETIGEKKERAIREAIAKDDVDKNPVSKNEVIITNKGHTLCYDAISGRYFESDIEQIKKVANEINRQMLIHDYISLNEFYDALGLENIPLGDELGWRIIDGYIDPLFSSHLAEDGRPCVVLKYSIAPKYGYSQFG